MRLEAKYNDLDQKITKMREDMILRFDKVNDRFNQLHLVIVRR